MSEYLTTEELAKILKVTEQTLVNWRKRDKGPPFFKIASCVRYDVKDLEKYLQTQKAKNND